jgi:hypothetical protein
VEIATSCNTAFFSNQEYHVNNHVLLILRLVSNAGGGDARRRNATIATHQLAISNILLDLLPRSVNKCRLLRVLSPHRVAHSGSCVSCDRHQALYLHYDVIGQACDHEKTTTTQPATSTPELQ